ncbi:Putative oxidoreductase SadH [Aquisphaera giovannonii]|uniref:Oxidoreductase SadH n=1 Tax=Aquisphaera giovannonii TaxID=406548 RepID=A0A5B9WED3_9BACT|nr:SDR family oxidoreductase [Aquisphaera giovannonii]QEH39018.1 Putative oxidoreductase SadH [Aquisphaera giovannonii]
MRKPLHEQAVVITGASSGIGRQTALEFARRGASLTLAARNDAALRALAEEIRHNGGKAQVVVTDVAEWDQVDRLAREAVAKYGRVDTWVNNAGVSVYAHFEDLSIEEIDRVIQVDLMGQIYGAKAILPHMRKQGSGTIINVGSMVSKRSVPLQSIYSAAKHAVKGFTDALRIELEHERAGIQVTLILPGSINTPFFSNARSKMGYKAAPPNPVYQPEAVAEAIVHAAEHPLRDVFIGFAAKAADLIERVSPDLGDQLQLAGGYGFESQKSGEPDNGRDNLLGPVAGPGRTHGEHAGHASSWYTRVFELNPGLKYAAAGLAAVGTVGLVAALARRTARPSLPLPSLDGHGNGYGRALASGIDSGLRTIGVKS